MAEFLQKQVLQDPTQKWVAPQHDGDDYDFDAETRLPKEGELTFKHEVFSHFTRACCIVMSIICYRVLLRTGQSRVPPVDGALQIEPG